MRRAPAKHVSLAKYGLPDISMPAIRKYARQIAERFKPHKIVLFGSFAYGEPNEDSDVDLLVVMPCANEKSQAVRIRLALDAPFPMDLIVRTPEKLCRRMEDNCWFLKEIMGKGKVLYDKRNQAMGTKSRVGFQAGQIGGGAKPPIHDGTCYHCQQCA